MNTMNENLKKLKELALAENKKRYPLMPEYARCTRTYSDRTANGLTKCIVAFLTFSGHQAERINSTGRPLDNTKIVTDVLNHNRRIGSIRWIPGTGTKGTADISATIRGKSLKIEIKMKDKQSPDQIRYQQQVEQSGGLYWICHSFDEFIELFNAFMTNDHIHI